VPVVVAQESPRQPAVVELIAELDAYLGGLYPAESNHLLDIEALAAPDMRFFVARTDGRAVGCGALRVDREGWGEVKRIYVHPAARGDRVGVLLLERVESTARREGLTHLRLETGIHQPEALGLFRRAGFVERAPFADYRIDPLSVYMEKTL
jgi:putative acetyltransferase